MTIEEAYRRIITAQDAAEIHDVLEDLAQSAIEIGFERGYEAGLEARRPLGERA